MGLRPDFRALISLTQPQAASGHPFFFLQPCAAKSNRLNSTRVGLAMRYGFLDSELRPTLLIWGDGLDLRQLAALLRMFAAHPREISLSVAGFESPTGTAVFIRCTRDVTGLVRAGEMVFDWLLSTELAIHFADLAERLADGSKGHQYLDGERDVCTVMLSLNEYPRDFLT